MYFLTMYNLSQIQIGIQSGHAQMEYALKYWENEDFQDWAQNHKTWIILNGGTSTHTVEYDFIGTMEESESALKEAGIDLATFCEPDLNGSLSAIAFLVDERVFNREDYPDLFNFMKSKIETPKLLELTVDEENDFFDLVKSKYPKEYGEWLDLIGGKKNAFLKDFIRNFKLA